MTNPRRSLATARGRAWHVSACRVRCRDISQSARWLSGAAAERGSDARRRISQAIKDDRRNTASRVGGAR